MSELTRFAAVLVLAGLIPASAAAQADSVAVLRRLLARVDSQLSRDAAQRLEEQARTAPQRLGRIQVASGITLVLHDATPQDFAARLAAHADSVMELLGYLAPPQRRQPILVADGVADTGALLSGPQFANRPRLGMDWAPQDTTDDRAWRILRPMSRFLGSILDPAWRRYASGDPVLWGWDETEVLESALDDLASEATSATGRECLAGIIASCRLWLGVDADSSPYATRYRPEELVAAAQNWGGQSPHLVPCRQGNGSACLRLYQPDYAPLPAIPAPVATRMTLLAVIRRDFGAATVQGILADSRGSIGERIARGTDLGTDSLIARWRIAVLSRGRSDRVSAGAGDLVSAVIFIGLLLALATRSGRWR